MIDLIAREKRTEMAMVVRGAEFWKQIELSESYLVCCMFEEAMSLASSVLKCICDDKSIEVEEGIQLHDMMEAAGMVLVQSLKGVGRTPEILNELKQLFGSVAVIPVQVLLAGACLQISDGSSTCVRQTLEDFLSMWRCVDEQYYVLLAEEANVTSIEKCDNRFVLGVDEYLEVVDVYVMNILGMVPNNMDVAVFWVEKAALPEERRQELLRRLHSLCSLKSSISSQDSHLLVDAHDSVKESKLFEASPKTLEAQYAPNGEACTKKAFLKLSGQVEPCFWWFRSITLKFGNVRLAISNGKILIGCLIFLLYWAFRRKRATLRGIVMRQALAAKKALVDLWQLAFSYQVNPLAAVQPLPAAPRGSR